MAKMQEKKLQVNQNIQLIVAEKREPDPTINIVTRSRVATGAQDSKTEKPTTQWVRCANLKTTPLDLQKQKEAFKQAQEYFSDSRASSSVTLPHNGIRPHMPSQENLVQD